MTSVIRTQGRKANRSKFIFVFQRRNSLFIRFKKYFIRVCYCQSHESYLYEDLAFFWFKEGLSWLMRPKTHGYDGPRNGVPLNIGIFSLAPEQRKIFRLDSSRPDGTQASTSDQYISIVDYFVDLACDDWWHPDDSIAVCVSRVRYAPCYIKTLDLDKNSRLAIPLMA